MGFEKGLCLGALRVARGTNWKNSHLWHLLKSLKGRTETWWYQRQLSFPDSIYPFCICRISDSNLLYCQRLQSTNQLTRKYSWKRRTSVCCTLATVDSFGLWFKNIYIFPERAWFCTYTVTDCYWTLLLPLVLFSPFLGWFWGTCKHLPGVAGKLHPATETQQLPVSVSANQNSKELENKEKSY